MKIRALILSLALGSAASAQDGPTYEETVSFLQSKLNVASNLNSQEITLPDRCRMNIHQRWYWGDEPDSYTDQTFSLDDIDPSKVELLSQGLQGWVSLVTFENRTVVRTVHTPENRTAYGNSASLAPILSPVAENGQRVVRALRHLISLCGGKEELF